MNFLTISFQVWIAMSYFNNYWKQGMHFSYLRTPTLIKMHTKVVGNLLTVDNLYVAIILMHIWI